ncbi:hypothetical protein BH11VER1_BH11VER1_17420 [soil metagenome]
MTNIEAIFHLALLGMYADGTLTEAEDTQINNLLTDLGWEDDTGVRAALVGNAFARVRAANVSEESLAAFLTTELKPALSAPGDKDRAMDCLRRVVAQDGVTSEENSLMVMVKWML